MMTSWIIPCNLKNYDVIGAFKRFRKLNWKQSAKSIEVGDTVFIYIGKPVSGIKYKCKVNKVNLKNREIIDDVFVINGEPYMEYGNYMELELLEVIDSQKYSLDYLNSHGVNGTIQGPRRVNALFDDKNKTISIGSDHEKTEVKKTPEKKNKEKKRAAGGKTRIKKLMKRVLSKCNIAYEGHIISKEQLMRAYALFLLQTMVKKEHNVGMVLHTGSICFDVMLVVYTAIINMISNSTQSKDVVASLNVGDIVIYGTKKREKYKFKGITDDIELGPEYKGVKYVLLEQDGDTRGVPENEWRNIEPYYGSVNALDGRGIKNNKEIKDDFYQEVLGYVKEDIPSVVDTSSVVVTSRLQADQLIKNITIGFGDKIASLLDLVTASYFSEYEEYPYRGNSGKNEAVLKFCSKLSVAKKQIKSRTGNKHLGVIILGQSIINRGVTELPALIVRSSLKYVFLSYIINPSLAVTLLPDSKNVEVFICAKQYLVQKPYNIACIENKYTKELVQQVDRIINRKNIIVKIDDFPISISEYMTFSKILVDLKREEYISNATRDFIIQAYSLMNIFMTIPVNIKDLNHIIAKHLDNITSPAIRLGDINAQIKEMPKEESKKLVEVRNILFKTYIGMVENNKKGSWITKYIQNNRHKKIAIIIPKAYFKDIINRSALLPVNNYKSNVSIYTYQKFDDGKMFDSIIVLGTKRSSKFNPFINFAAKEIYSLLYPVEIYRYNSYKKNEHQNLNEILKYASNFEMPLDVNDDNGENEDSEEILGYERSIDDFISSSIVNFDDFQRDGSTKGHLLAEITAVAVLEDERKVFFSKNYKAYVLDIDGDGIKEVGTSDLSEGDSLVFTKNNNETKDIVDTILCQLMESGKLSAIEIEAYRESNVWKDCLRNYMTKGDLSVQEITEKMIDLGVPVEKSTIRGWLDEDSHTVGPRKIESIKIIGKLTGNSSLENNADKYYSMCQQTRILRRKILKLIGEMIKDKFRGKEPAGGSLLYDIYNKIDDIAEVLQIEVIRSTEQQIPGNRANRPISVG